MANVMNMTKLRNKPSRNGFDLSRKLAFSAKVGELLPVECIECIPGDKFKIRKQHFTRTMPVNTAAYTRIREYYDWFFVPTNLMWNKFNTFVSQMVDNGQHATSISDNMVVGTQHPYFSVQQVKTYINNLTNDRNKNIFGYNRQRLSEKLLEYLGYKTFVKPTDFINEATGYTNLLLNPFPLLAYQKIYQDYYRNSQWEKSYAPSWNIDYMNGSNMELPLSSIDYDVDNMFDLRYCNWNKDYFMGLLPNSQFGSPATVDLSSILNPQNSTNLFLFSSDSAGDAQFKSFQNPSVPNANSVLSNGGGSSNIYFDKDSITRISDAIGLTKSSLSSAFTILALRQAEAAQKWAEITQSQQQDYKSQMEAHFGVDLSDAYSERCRFIDGQVSNIDISEVLNQSLNGDDIANVKGKGVGVGDGYINFSTDVHGYLMCIYHAVPILDYQISGVKKSNLKTMVTDYAIPEFDKTGMVKVNIAELMSVWPTRTGTSLAYQNLQLGYAPQYYEYKTNYDEVVGAFTHGGLSSWVAPFNEGYIYDYISNLVSQGIDTITYHFFKVNPSVLNPIFISQITEGTGTDANNDVAADQLLINVSFENHAVRNLDYNGLPY